MPFLRRLLAIIMQNTRIQTTKSRLKFERSDKAENLEDKPKYILMIRIEDSRDKGERAGSCYVKKQVTIFFSFSSKNLKRRFENVIDPC